MDPQNISDNVNELTGSIKDYVKLRIRLLKVSLTEKMSRVLSLVIMTMVFFVLFLFLVLFISIAFIFWFREHAGPAYAGALIVAGFYLVLALIIYLLRFKFFIDPVVAELSKIMLEEEEDTKDER